MEIKKNPWDKAYYRARTRFKNGYTVSFTITKQDVKDAWIRDGASLMEKPSIDRIDSSRGYDPDNIQIIEHRLNCSKDISGEKNYLAKLTKEQAISICEEMRDRMMGDHRGLKLAQKYNVSDTAIKHIISGKSYKEETEEVRSRIKREGRTKNAYNRYCGDCKHRQQIQDTHYFCTHKTVLKNLGRKAHKVRADKNIPYCDYYQIKQSLAEHFGGER